MSLSTERERVIESLRVGIGATAEYVDPSEFVVIREAGGTLHFFAFKDDGSYVAVSLGSEESSGEASEGHTYTYEAATNSPADGEDVEFTFTGRVISVFRNGVNESRLGQFSENPLTFIFDAVPDANDDIEALVEDAGVESSSSSS